MRIIIKTPPPPRRDLSSPLFSAVVIIVARLVVPDKLRLKSVGRRTTVTGTVTRRGRPEGLRRGEPAPGHRLPFGPICEHVYVATSWTAVYTRRDRSIRESARPVRESLSVPWSCKGNDGRSNPRKNQRTGTTGYIQRITDVLYSSKSIRPVNFGEKTLSLWDPPSSIWSSNLIDFIP